jgi:hypothetical protein
MASSKTPATKRPGRPALAEEDQTIPITLRLTGAQRKKLAKLGGAPWVREKIDKAKLPNE